MNIHFAGVHQYNADRTEEIPSRRVDCSNASEQRAAGQAPAKERDEFIALTKKIAHDINSPLAALSMVLSSIDTIPDSIRPILTQSLARIGNASKELRDYCLKLEAGCNAHNPVCLAEQVGPVWLAAHVLSVFNDKAQALDLSRIDFTNRIDASAQCAFIAADSHALPSLLANLIDNAVTALNGKSGKVHLDLKAEQGEVILRVADTGIGMPNFIRSRILQGVSCADDSGTAHGFGMQRLTQFLKKYHGALEIHSIPNDGARITVKFPQIAQPDWALTKLTFRPDQIVVIADDDPTRQSIWYRRLEKILRDNPAMRLFHFDQVQAMCDHIAQLSVADTARVCLLTDMAFLKQGDQGADQKLMSLICLVTAQHPSDDVLAYAKKIDAKIIPACLVGYVPIDVAG